MEYKKKLISFLTFRLKYAQSENILTTVELRSFTVKLYLSVRRAEYKDELELVIVAFLLTNILKLNTLKLLK